MIVLFSLGTVSCMLTCTFLLFNKIIIFSLRARLSEEDEEINALHGSANPEDAERELQYFFPMEETMAVIKPSAVTEKGLQHELQMLLA